MDDLNRLRRLLDLADMELCEVQVSRDATKREHWVREFDQTIGEIECCLEGRAPPESWAPPLPER